MDHSIPFLHLQPDEVVAGYIGRLALRLGLEPRQCDVRCRLHQRLQEIGYHFRNDIFSIVKYFSGVTREEIIKLHSMAPISYAFYNCQTFSLAYVCKRRGNAIDREVLDLLAKPKACSQCVQSDLQELGFSFWHRVHQFPGAIYCPLHDQRLISFSTCHPYYSQPHHLISTPTSGHSAHAVNREFHDRMMKIWLLFLKRKSPVYISTGLLLVSNIYRFSWHDVCDQARIKIAAVSEHYSFELAQSLEERSHSNLSPYYGRLIVAALAASDIEIEKVPIFFNTGKKLRYIP